VTDPKDRNELSADQYLPKLDKFAVTTTHSSAFGGKPVETSGPQAWTNQQELFEK
jgi:hypothetical protein